MTPETFVYAKNFVGLTTEDIESALLEVQAQWSGALSFWSDLPTAIRDVKRESLVNLLVAWHLADLMPRALDGVASNGGMPLKAKSIGGVDLEFLPIETQAAMSPLLTNTFGIRALQAILSAPERFGICGGPSPTVSIGWPYGI